MTSPERLMSAGMPANQAVQIGMPSTPAAGLVGTGTNKATAVALIAGVNIIATVASAGVAYFQLPTAEASPPVVVQNRSATALSIVANGATDTINALSAAAAFTQTGSKNAVYFPGKNNAVTPSVGNWTTNISA